jgi:hypothetical protein
VTDKFKLRQRPPKTAAATAPGERASHQVETTALLQSRKYEVGIGNISCFLIF